jgi:hypothetical protein
MEVWLASPGDVVLGHCLVCLELRVLIRAVTPADPSELGFACCSARKAVGLGWYCLQILRVFRSTSLSASPTLQRPRDTSLEKCQSTVPSHALPSSPPRGRPHAGPVNFDAVARAVVPAARGSLRNVEPGTRRGDLGTRPICRELSILG